jgi:predicted esterase|tara:strand:+ start:1937 stop:2737 length:801 start_codon:yes stop_codon:yes gene_type:complete
MNKIYMTFHTKFSKNIKVVKSEDDNNEKDFQEKLLDLLEKNSNDTMKFINEMRFKVDNNTNNIDNSINNNISNKKRILVLHGGGDSSQGIRNQQGMQDLMNSELLDNNIYEFVFIDSPLNGGVWWNDSPGKKEKTTDTEWANTSITFLTEYIENNGPFYGILGYSQGAAMAIVLLAYTNIVFERVLLFNGYLPITHQGLIDTINLNKPYTISPLIFIAENDYGFYNLGLDIKNTYENYTELISKTAGHALPRKNDSMFESIINYIK